MLGARTMCGTAAMALLPHRSSPPDRLLFIRFGAPVLALILCVALGAAKSAAAAAPVTGPDLVLRLDARDMEGRGAPQTSHPKVRRSLPGPRRAASGDVCQGVPDLPRGRVKYLRYLSARSPLIELATSGKHHDVKVDPVGLLRLIARVDANCPSLGEEGVRAMADPGFRSIDRLPVRPRLKTAPVIERP